MGAAEQRIQFKEVQLREKAHEQLDEHKIAHASMTPTNDMQSEDDGQALGRMTGSIAPTRKRKKRRNKEKDASPQEEGKDDAMDTS